MGKFLRLGAMGMRGVIGNGLGVRITTNYLSAIATWLGEGPVILATDTRQSSAMLKSTALASFMAAGLDVIDVGVLPAPVVHYLVEKEGAAGACLIGAGHHPEGWNAIVPLNKYGALPNRTQNQELIDIYHSRKFKMASWDEVGQVRHLNPDQAIQSYIQDICKNIDVEAIRERQFKIVADMCNGSGCVVAKALYRHLGVDATVINDRKRGHLPHTPEPRPRAAYQVQALISPLAAAIGFVFNSDASRVSIVSSRGETMSEEYTLPVVAQAMLEKAGPGAKVVTNICTTRSLDQIVERFQGELIKTEVGQAEVIERMIDMDALLCGEGSGTIAFNEGIRGCDALKATVIILEYMATHQITSKEIADELPRLRLDKRKIVCSSAQAYSALALLREAFADATVIDESDGLRCDWLEGWFHVRFSQTEPMLRIISEWPTREQAEEKIRMIENIVSGGRV